MFAKIVGYTYTQVYDLYISCAAKTVSKIIKYCIVNSTLLESHAMVAVVAFMQRLSDAHHIHNM